MHYARVRLVDRRQLREDYYAWDGVKIVHDHNVMGRTPDEQAEIDRRVEIYASQVAARGGRAAFSRAKCLVWFCTRAKDTRDEV